MWAVIVKESGALNPAPLTLPAVWGAPRDENWGIGLGGLKRVLVNSNEMAP